MEFEYSKRTKEYMEQLKSPFADVANIGGRDAGAITAAAD